MDENALLRKAMYVQRSLLNVPQTSGHLTRKGVYTCWLQHVSCYMCLFPMGERVWKEWWLDNSFRVSTSRVVQSPKGCDAVCYVRWEDDMLNEVCMVARNEWMKVVYEGKAQGRRCIYKISNEIRASMPKDSEVRQLHLDASHKLRMYAVFKENLHLEAYLREVTDVRKRRLMSMLRMGVLPLRIETGRYEACKVVGSKGVPVEFRVCKCCALSKVEDEIHFVLECPLYSRLRVSLLEVCTCEIGKKFTCAWEKRDMKLCFKYIF